MTTDTPTPAADADAGVVEVMQADRDFTARWLGYGSGTNDRIRAGELDHAPGVQATARHRLATTPPSPDSAVREAIPVWRLIDDETPKDGTKVLLYPDRNMAGWGWCVGSWRRGVVYIHGLGNREVEGWWERGFFMGPQPTHWLPQPALATPPAVGGEDGHG